VQRILNATDQVSNNLLAQKEDLEYVLEQMPESVKVLNRQALNGDYFSFYFCELVLKLNGKGGQPMYVKVAGQPSGRCTPK
jgi:phospholipid/cholesterol/gamma-HCH transport system substrate-binding protein